MKKLVHKLAIWVLDRNGGLTKMHSDLHWAQKDKKHFQNLAEWAETLLCSSRPPNSCSQEQWDNYIRSWRDTKHGVVNVELKPKMCTRKPGHSGPCNGYCCR